MSGETGRESEPSDLVSHKYEDDEELSLRQERSRSPTSRTTRPRAWRVWFLRTMSRPRSPSSTPGPPVRSGHYRSCPDRADPRSISLRPTCSLTPSPSSTTLQIGLSTLFGEKLGRSRLFYTPRHSAISACCGVIFALLRALRGGRTNERAAIRASSRRESIGPRQRPILNRSSVEVDPSSSDDHPSLCVSRSLRAFHPATRPQPSAGLCSSPK